METFYHSLAPNGKHFAHARTLLDEAQLASPALLSEYRKQIEEALIEAGDAESHVAPSVAQFINMELARLFMLKRDYRKARAMLLDIHAFFTEIGDKIAVKEAEFHLLHLDIQEREVLL